MSPERPTRGPGAIFSRPLLNFALAAAFGIAAGLGIFTFLYAEGLSYFSDNPESCVNCHVMRDQFDAWNHSSHKAVAACNDCHTPHGTYLEKYFIKGVNGWNHSLAFTTGSFPDPIRIKGFNAVIAQENCIACHATAVGQMHYAGSLDIENMSCVSCHGNVGHGQTGVPLHGPIFPYPQSAGQNEQTPEPAGLSTDAEEAREQSTLSNQAEPADALDPEELDDEE
jgi:cytochrome c nitrite reductase small subunit